MPYLVSWSGIDAPAPLLRWAGLAIGTPAVAAVVATARAQLPVAPPAAPWLWVCRAPLGDEHVVAAARAGAYDAISLADRGAAERLAARIAELAAPAPAIDPGDFVAWSPAAHRVLDQIARAARTSMPVLFTGETGTGKDVAARLLHERSGRGKRRFVAINCAAVPNELIESELFGHVRGAFSGAVADYDGQLTAAAGGTVFLDVIDDTPPTLQVKLLRVLDDRVVSRLGENEWREVDFRLTAATNRDLPALVADGRFAGDLYQRLAIVQIHMPPLRERPEDLVPLIEVFLARFHDEETAARKRPVRGIAPAAVRALAAYPWPGNIRELRNVIYQALVGKRGGDEILAADLPRHVLAPDATAAPTGIVDRAALAARIDAGAMNLRALLESVERTALELALARAGGSPTRAARLLGEVGRGRSSDPGATVRAMMQRLALSGRAGARSR